MGLYSVMLVDDEEEVRQAIIKRVDWEAIGFQVVDSAENGEEALEKAERICPDVVMTDIQMPFMDGLTFCRKLKEHVSGTKIVIFSGYDEFEYAKEAIKLEAEEYILKPVDATELKNVFLRIKERLDEELDRKRNVERLEKYYLESLPLIKEQFIMGLLGGRMTQEEEIRNLCASYKMQLDAPCYVATVFKPDFDSKQGKVTLDANLLLISLKQMVDEQLDSEWNFRSIQDVGIISGVILLEDSSLIPAFIQAAEKICKLANKILDVNVTAGIGNLCNKLTMLHQSYKEAQAAAEYRILLEPNKAIYIQDIEPKSEARFLIGEQELQKIIIEIKVGTKEGLENSIRELVDQMKNASISLPQLQNAFAELFVEIMRLVRVFEVDTEQIDGMNLNFFSKIKEFYSLDTMGEWLLSICLQLRGQIRAERKDVTRLVIDKAKGYIQENYADSELSVEKLCSFLGLSATYFSTLFKRETGESFVMYLTQVRMEKARQLLNTTEEKAYVISQMVGYTEPNYFSYVFKKLYGVSPSKYRAN